MAQQPLRRIESMIQKFMASPLPEKLLPYIDEDTIEGTLEKFGTAMYMQTGRDYTGWTDVNRILSVMENQLTPFHSDSVEYASHSAIIQLFLTFVVQPRLQNPSALIKGIQTLAHRQNVTVTDDNFDTGRLRVIAGIDQSPSIPEVKFAAARGIKISFDGEYVMRIERPERLPHATHLGKYDWKSLTAERTTPKASGSPWTWWKERRS
ncbi:hypothetical protein [Lacticaseibacillus zeae]|nr:hypothetical protein [Lacticaseibacillus zeae]